MRCGIRVSDAVVLRRPVDTIVWHCRWAVLFSHPKDYTPVCTTELGNVVKIKDQFAKRGVKMIALSCDSVEDHKGWTKV